MQERCPRGAQTARDGVCKTGGSPHRETRPVFHGTLPRLSIELEKAQVAETHDPLLPDTRTAFTVGANFPLGGRIGDRFALGIVIFSPTDSAIRGEMYSAQAPQFYRYENRPDRFVAITALAYRISEQLSVGAGVQLFADLLGCTSRLETAR